MKTAIDSTLLLVLFVPDAPPPMTAGGDPVLHAVERLRHFIKTECSTANPLVIPAPVLAEALVSVVTDEDTARLMAFVEKPAGFQVEPFGARAAIEVARLSAADTTARERRELRPRVTDRTAARVKVDRQVIGLCRALGVARLITDDNGLASRAAREGIQVVGSGDLPLPPEMQQISLAIADERGAGPASVKNAAASRRPSERR